MLIKNYTVHLYRVFCLHVCVCISIKTIHMAAQANKKNKLKFNYDVEILQLKVPPVQTQAASAWSKLEARLSWTSVIMHNEQLLVFLFPSSSSLSSVYLFRAVAGCNIYECVVARTLVRLRANPVSFLWVAAPAVHLFWPPSVCLSGAKGLSCPASVRSEASAAWHVEAATLGRQKMWR